MVETNHRASGTVEAHELRSVAQLRMLHALATRLNALDDVDAIGEAITTELKTLMPEDAKEAVGHGVRGRRSKSGAVSFELLQTEAAHA